MQPRLGVFRAAGLSERVEEAVVRVRVWGAAERRPRCIKDAGSGVREASRAEAAEEEPQRAGRHGAARGESVGGEAVEVRALVRWQE